MENGPRANDLLVIAKIFHLARPSLFAPTAFRPARLRRPPPAPPLFLFSSHTDDCAIFAHRAQIHHDPGFLPAAHAAPSLNDRTKRGEASALRSQAVAKGLMVLPWQLLRAYCCTPQQCGSLVPPHPVPSHGIFICM